MMTDPHNCQAIDEAAEQARERVAAADEQRRREVAAAYDLGWDEALDEARQQCRSARDLAHVDRILAQLAADGSTGPRQHDQPLGDPARPAGVDQDGHRWVAGDGPGEWTPDPGEPR